MGADADEGAGKESMENMSWHKGIVKWELDNHTYLSIPFTWLLPDAQNIINIERLKKKKIIVGGPAVKLMPDFLHGCSTSLDTPYDVLSMHNPLATFTTRGCPNQCSFCAVPKIEGEFRELESWKPNPIVCDNNLLAASWKHFERVVDSLKRFPYADFNQGLDARLFTANHAQKLSELKKVKVRFAFDHISQENAVVQAIAIARQSGLREFGVYVLIGFEDTPEDALYRLETIRSLGIHPNPMRYQPLYSLSKNSYLPDAWTELEMRRVMRYYSRLSWLEHIPFAEFNPEYYEQYMLIT